MYEITENIFNEELNKLLLRKIPFREKNTRRSTTRGSKIWNEEIQNMPYSIHGMSLNLKDNSS